MGKSRSLFFILCLFLLSYPLSIPAASATLNVPSTDYLTIQSALNACATGDAVVVAAGTYLEHDILWPNINNITLHGAGKNTTTLDAQSLGRCISIESPVSATIEGLSIKSGKITGNNGGGIYINNSSANFSVYECYFSGNSAVSVPGRDVYGGAIFNRGTLVSYNNIFNANKTIADAYGDPFGAGIHNTGYLKAVNNIFSINESKTSDTPYVFAYGGGISNTGIINIFNCVFYGNRATSPSGSKYGGGIYNSGTVNGKNLIFLSNSPQNISGQANISYSDVPGGFSGTGNINVNPKFISTLEGNSGYFRLSAGSPCIDSGTLEGLDVMSDLDGLARPRGLAVDMGVFEFIGPSVKVTFPNGGEIIDKSGAINVTWKAADEYGLRTNPPPISIRCSTNEGAFWIKLADNIENTGNYAWDPPFIVSGKYLISIEASNSRPDNNWNCDTSNGSFEIKDYRPPVAEITFPKAGITFGAGANNEITWYATDESGFQAGNKYISIYYTTRESENIWQVITTEASNTINGSMGAYSWDIPANILQKDALVNARISIEVRDVSNNKSRAISEQFSIAGLSSTVHVSPSRGSDKTGDGSINNPYATVQKGLKRAADNCIVTADDGIYHEHDIIWPNRNNIKLKSASGSWETCIVSADAIGRVFNLSSLNGSYFATIEGITITNGYAYGTDVKGGGILCNPVNNVSSVKCRFLKNMLDAPSGKGNYGGGMCYGKAISCVFENNFAKFYGSGLYGGTAVNCIFTKNSASTNNGAAISGGSAINCIFYKNNVGPNATAATENTTATNCTFYNNSGYRVVEGGTLMNCIYWDANARIFNNPAINYSDVKGGYAGTGNISREPLFISTAEGSEDFRLLPGSPCIDAGTFETGIPDYDFNGIERPKGLGCDMGAYERNYASLSTVYVSPNGDDIAGTGSETNPVKTISNAFVMVNPVGKILLFDGIYHEWGINWPNKNNLTLKSVSGSSETCIVSGDAQNMVFDLSLLNSSSYATIEGITITNGHFHSFPPKGGSGIRCVSKNNYLINCIISNNFLSRPDSTGLTFPYGGGMYNGTAINCIFYGNLAAGDEYPDWGGLGDAIAEAKCVNCILYGNDAYNSTLKNCIVWNSFINSSSSAEYSDIQGPITAGKGNINADPLFVSPQTRNFRLLFDPPLSISPCIDKGTSEGAPSYDINNAKRPQVGGYDMGAYELKTTAPQILKNSILIDGKDLSRVGYFSENPTVEADIKDIYLDYGPISIEVKIGATKCNTTSEKNSKDTMHFIANPEKPLTRGEYNVFISATNYYGAVDEFSTSSFSSGVLSLTGKPKNIPNPFRPSHNEGTTIIYELTAASDITIIIYDISGKAVWQRTFSSGTNGGNSGQNNVFWDGKNDFGEYVANGVYIYIIAAKDKILAKRQMAVLD
jgi:hypothetical protein